eukprot:364521-Chlamydomonas_euryale.AAC.5
MRGGKWGEMAGTLLVHGVGPTGQKRATENETHVCTPFRDRGVPLRRLAPSRQSAPPRMPATPHAPPSRKARCGRGRRADSYRGRGKTTLNPRRDADFERALRDRLASRGRTRRAAAASRVSTKRDELMHSVDPVR